MIPIPYDYGFEYSYDAEGRLCPLLRFLASNIADVSAVVDLEATPDSGAERSLFNGRIGTALGIDVMRGPGITFSTMAGGVLSATLHPIRLTHPELGTFELEVAFSTGEISRNLHGRDFFDLLQIGFREHHLTFYVTPNP